MSIEICIVMNLEKLEQSCFLVLIQDYLLHIIQYSINQFLFSIFIEKKSSI